MTLEKLQKKYPVFSYDKVEWQLEKQNLQTRFSFSAGPQMTFVSELTIPNVSSKEIERVGEKQLHNLFFHLGLVDMLSYWKATFSPEIKVEAGGLNTEQIKWWEKIILEGMGQFFYENDIDPFVPRIKTKEKEEIELPEVSSEDYLLPQGGGKDSLVALEIIKQTGKIPSLFIFNPNEKLYQVAEVSETEEIITASRTLDPKIKQLNKEGFLNGHTPFSAYLAFLSAIIAALFDKKHIVFANEKSSEEANTIYKKKEINHQWSKTLEFENMFRQYSSNYLLKKLNYFSLMRPLYDIQISSIFSHLEKYHHVFLSCNSNFKLNGNVEEKWCRSCPKCLNTFLLLKPFLDKEELTNIFGGEMEREDLLPLRRKLSGEEGIKPLECVATFKEINSVINGNTEDLLDQWDEKHNVPEELQKILWKNLKRN